MDSLEIEVKRGVEAKQVIENPLFQEAISKVQEDIFEKFSSTDPVDLEGLRVQRIRLKCLAEITRNIQSVVETGFLAQEEIARQKSLADRAVDRMKKGIRAVF